MRVGQMRGSYLKTLRYAAVLLVTSAILAACGSSGSPGASGAKKGPGGLDQGLKVFGRLREMVGIVFGNGRLKFLVETAFLTSLSCDRRHASCDDKRDELDEPATWGHSLRMLAP